MTGLLIVSTVSSARIQARLIRSISATVGRKADLAQLREILQALADSKIVGAVDCGLGAQRAIFFVILLDARVFVVDVQRGVTP
jgi:hypothetical protein